MQRYELVFYLLVTLLCDTFAQEWDYQNQRLWQGECTIGNRQSPINLNQNEAKSEWNIPFGHFSRVDFYDYDKPADGNFTNNGHTVQMTLVYNDSSRTPRTVVTNDCGDATTFVFQSLHFHWPCEHEIDGKGFLLELHIVHRSENGSILVLGFVFQNCRSSCSGMEVVGAAVRRLVSLGDSVSISQFAPERIMPSPLSQCDFFQYNGSLTTPPCTQNVTWLVYSKPLCVDQQEMNAFNAVENPEGEPMAGNNRDLQPKNDRTITYYMCPFDWWSWLSFPYALDRSCR